MYLFMHIFDPDLSSQIAAYEAKNTIDGNYYDFGYYIRYIRQSCASYGNADNYKRIASDNFPHGFSVHPIWIAEHQDWVCRILEEDRQGITDESTSNQHPELPSK